MPYLRFDKQENEWKQIDSKEKIDTDLYLDGLLKKKLDFAKKQIKKNNDVVGIIEGEEGVGKGAIGGNIMRYMCEDSFDPLKNMIGSDFNEAIDKITNIEKGGALMFDEGNVFFLSTETMKREQRDLHKIFSIFRQKNLFVLIILPSFFRLGTYFAMDRSKFLIRAYEKDGKRGFFGYYGKKAKFKLYQKGKKTYDSNAVPPTFRGRFTTCYTLETEWYKSFKEETLLSSINQSKEKMKPVLTPKQNETAVFMKLIDQNPDKTSVELGELLNIQPSRVRKIRQDLRKIKKEEEEKEKQG